MSVIAVPETTNPYAAPAASLTGDSPADHLWRVEGVGVLLRNGAVLPPIDLETGDDRPPFVERRWRLSKNHWSINCMGLVAVILPLVPRRFLDWHPLPSWLPITIMCGVWILVLLAVNIVLRKRIIFTTLCHPARETRRKRVRNIRAVAYAASCALLFVPLVSVFNQLMDLRLGATLGSVVPGVFGMLAIAVWQYRDRPRLLPTWERDDLIRLGGVHLQALQHLEERSKHHCGEA